MKIKHFVIAVFIMFLVSMVWVSLEQIIYGAPESRVVDDIMILLMLPFFYITSVWLEEKSDKKKNKTKQKGPLSDVECFDDMDAEDS